MPNILNANFGRNQSNSLNVRRQKFTFHFSDKYDKQNIKIKAQSLQRQRYKFLSHYVNKQSFLLNTNKNIKTREKPPSQVKDLRIKLKQIQKINNFGLKRSNLRKTVLNSDKNYFNQKWKDLLKKQKISNSTYQQARKTIYKNHKNSFIIDFDEPNGFKTTKLQLFCEQKPNYLLNFFRAYPNFTKQSQLEQNNGWANLNILKQLLQKSQLLSQIYLKIKKSKQYENLKYQNLSSNFISAIYVLQWIKKNGLDDQAKDILLKSKCFL